MSEEKLNELFNIIDEGYPSIQEQKIRNYITNLQEENERLNNIIEELKELVISDIKIFEKLKEDNDEEYYLGRITTAKKVLSYFEKVDDE